MEKQIEILNKIREEFHEALGKKRSYPFQWNTNTAKFEAETGGFVLDDSEKKTIKRIFSNHGIKVGFFLSRGRAGYSVKVDDSGLLELLK